ncbi:MAG: hypothetical protein HKO62_13380 [Gammaproteobacteria bacterium]|nr:hypothetical protein [Gammaproteobacteria bacterium]NNM01739.1 hypothetical protein [Gammaproteobacteria bacterium]
MDNNDRIKATRAMLEPAGVRDFSDDDVARVAAGAEAASGAVERVRHYCRFDSVPGVFHEFLIHLADQDDSR